jgi:hypothetical protein
MTEEQAFTLANRDGVSRYPARSPSRSGALSRRGYAANVLSSWIPVLDGGPGQAHVRTNAAGIGCGLGAWTILLARAYPNSAFAGADYHSR